MGFPQHLPVSLTPFPRASMPACIVVYFRTQYKRGVPKNLQQNKPGGANLSIKLFSWSFASFDVLSTGRGRGPLLQSGKVLSRERMKIVCYYVVKSGESEREGERGGCWT